MEKAQSTPTTSVRIHKEKTVWETETKTGSDSANLKLVFASLGD